ncbi:MAG: hypothetical protein HQ522_11195 [Bacteroidetes bacterium]|nr:hypothetical protein [Bacteroidota bacterium]
MKKFTVLFILLISMSLITFAKKDIDAWKSEKNLNQQYTVFKQNLNFWNGSIFLKETQIDQFYNAVTDSITGLDKEILANEKQILSLQNELDTKTSQIEETQVKLNESIKRVNSISVMGQNINKTAYTFFMYMLTLGLAVLSGFVFLLFKRSNKITTDTKKEYKEIKEEFELYKKSSMDRYTKINTELHNTRMKLNKM